MDAAPDLKTPARRQGPFLAPAGLALLGLLTATPGVHLFERWMAHGPAVVVSHGLAVGLLAAAAVRWRAARRGGGAALDVRPVRLPTR